MSGHVKQRGDALIDENDKIFVTYSDLASSSPTARDFGICSSDFSDSSDLSQKLKEVSNIDDSSSPRSKRSKLTRRPCSEIKDSLLNRSTSESGSSSQKVVRSPYFSRPIQDENSPRNALESSQISWSASPTFHKKETLVTLEKTGIRLASKSLAPGTINQASKRSFYSTTNSSTSQELEFSRKPQSTTKFIPSNMSPMAPVFLSKEQVKVLEVVVRDGQSVFFTGAAGTGKSVLLQRIIADLYKKFESRKTVGVTASTGLAALNIGGTTLHSFTGIGLGKGTVQDLVKKIRRNRKKLTNWKRLKALVIDEISMIDGELFEKLEQIARIIRKDDQPFGGIQLIICGDFFQLPPVSVDREVKFAFEAESWDRSISHTILLQQVFRQKDPAFSSMLNEMRRGDLTHQTIYTFKGLSRRPDLPEGMTPTELYPRRIQVEQSNKRQLKRLKGVAKSFKAEDFYSSPEAEQIFNLENLIAVNELSLKKGAQVMMIKNIDETLVNGSTGVVLGFMSESSFEMAENSDADISTILSQQSQSGDAQDTINAEKIFALPNNENEIQEDRENVGWTRKKERLQKLRETREELGEEWPVVRFFQIDGTTRDVLCQPETWSFENDEGEVIARRSQVPLILAWALSIHKSQGQTLKWVKVDLAHTFERGQAYVAVSRAVSLSGLQVLGFSPDKVMVHDKVIEFYDDLDSVFDLKKDKNKAKPIVAEKEFDQVEAATNNTPIRDESLPVQEKYEHAIIAPNVLRNMNTNESQRSTTVSMEDIPEEFLFDSFKQRKKEHFADIAYSSPI